MSKGAAAGRVEPDALLHMLMQNTRLTQESAVSCLTNNGMDYDRAMADFIRLRVGTRIR